MEGGDYLRLPGSLNLVPKWDKVPEWEILQTAFLLGFSRDKVEDRFHIGK
jgi:hypothetical protein